MLNNTTFPYAFPFHCISQSDYFDTTQLSLLVIIVSFLHPATFVKTNWTCSFVSDDTRHTGVRVLDFFFYCCIYFPIPNRSSRFPLPNNVCIQDLVHHAVETVLTRIRQLYVQHGVSADHIKHVLLWSDNCAGQFKSKANLGWAVKFAPMQNLVSLVRPSLFDVGSGIFF